MDLFIILIWIFLSAIAGHIAAKKGRSEIGFFMLAVITTPPVGILCAMLANKNKEHLDNIKLKKGILKQCPYCAEIIKKQALVCRYCSRELKI